MVIFLPVTKESKGAEILPEFLHEKDIIIEKNKNSFFFFFFFEVNAARLKILKLSIYSKMH